MNRLWMNSFRGRGSAATSGDARLGGANAVKIKVRQPLAELKVGGTDGDRRAIGRFSEQLCDELNIERVTWHDSQSLPLLTAEVKANLKSSGPKAAHHCRR